MELEKEIFQKNFKGEHQKATVNLIYTYNWAVSNLKDEFVRYDITIQQFNILRILRGQHPSPATINLLKERMLDKMCDASRMVERLRQKELIDRCVNKQDRRSVDIRISQKGLGLLEHIDREYDPNELFSNLSLEEAQELNRLLDKVRGSRTYKV